MIQEFHIGITVVNKETSFDFSPNIPCILADKIKNVVNNFYNNTNRIVDNDD